ncbi:LysR family transcriptional regulator [Leucobacter allii]|uniref:LysR family transcriptional regulator n=1 Tax=Leucobacter allii TaxID=2932247 RepID=A0ABY4FMD6_9MICO|nr:LysR family transcriptional regulator [Leucobacter allii]UOQ57424.1 LysR family transcriptional regulator [Leucobacter allii]
MSRLDLNLLIALDALLTERSVTRAAARLHLSQPALSASLSRLRTHFGDPLLARRGNAYELTPLAVRLAEHTSTALEAARRVFESQADWTPEASTREFLVYGSDYAFATVGQAASKLAAAVAPGVRFRFELHTPGLVEEAQARMRSADGILIPHGHITDLRSTELWSDRWVLLADARHPFTGKTPAMTDLAERPWVFTYQSRSAFTSVGQQLRALGIEPRIEAVVQSFLALPHFIRGTDRLGVVQSAVALHAAELPGIRIVDPPFDAVPVANALWWHPVHEHDPEHAWMRSIFQSAGRTVAKQTAIG